jgi:catechol 2,3-dioxygenase-like lactoylglutathione lyase family enzyme
MKASFEVVILPVADPDRSLHLYRDQEGFDVDVDYAPAPDLRVIQLTPQRSGTSIQFGAGLTDAAPGFADIRDPEDNAWALQERHHRPT